MATVYGSIRTSANTGGLAAMTAKGTYDARIKCMVDSYEASATAAGSIILMGGNLPTGARIQEIILGFDQMAPSANILLVGDSASMARYLTVSGTTATVTRLALVDGMDYVVGTSTGDNIITVLTSGTSASTGTIKLAVLYSQD